MTRPTRDLETIERTYGPPRTAMWLARAVLTAVVVLLLTAAVWVLRSFLPAW
jgi:hypothetical protein